MRLILAVLALALSTLAGVAGAQNVGAITNPIWLVAPGQGQLPFRFYLDDFRERVSVKCVVAADRLAQCSPLEATPQSLFEAAMDAVAVARIAARDGNGTPTNQREIVVEIRFRMPIPVAIDPPPAPPSDVLTGMIWLERPDGADFARLYPVRAAQEHVSGRATLDCLVGHDGRLSCTILLEDPPNYGFGDATIRISREFRAATETAAGAPTSGGRVRLPIRWAME